MPRLRLPRRPVLCWLCAARTAGWELDRRRRAALRRRVSHVRGSVFLPGGAAIELAGADLRRTPGEFFEAAAGLYLPPQARAVTEDSAAAAEVPERGAGSRSRQWSLAGDLILRGLIEG